VELRDHGAKFQCTVSNQFGLALSETVTLQVGAGAAGLPLAEILQPELGASIGTGVTVAFSGRGTSALGEAIPAVRMHWRIDLYRDGQVQPGIVNVNGNSGGAFSSTILPEGIGTGWLRFYLSVVDSANLVGTVIRDYPLRSATVLLRTQPAGLKVLVNGAEVADGASISALAGSIRRVEAVSTQRSGTNIYGFARWSDDGARAHDITIPSSPQVLTVYHRIVS